MDEMKQHTEDVVKLAMYCSLILGIIIGGCLVGMAWVIWAVLRAIL